MFMCKLKKMDEIDRDLKKNIGFKPNYDFIEPESITYLQHLGEYRQRSEWMSKACQFYYEYEHYKKGWFVRLIENNFEFCKHLLRVVGRARK